RTARPDIVPEYHREAGREADDGIGKHDWPVGNRDFDYCASAHQETDHEQDGEKADKPRKENSESGHASLRYIE
ncbi:MAG TPA: hypothetical protein VJ487_18240, partial [Alphaproteobacteria bacterium]|nr:hypothetical protein [Alphaproteobacteria bacterium]